MTLVNIHVQLCFVQLIMFCKSCYMCRGSCCWALVCAGWCTGAVTDACLLTCPLPPPLLASGAPLMWMGIRLSTMALGRHHVRQYRPPQASAPELAQMPFLVTTSCARFMSAWPEIPSPVLSGLLGGPSCGDCSAHLHLCGYSVM